MPWDPVSYFRAKSEKAMAPHSSTLAWRIPGTGEPDGLLSMRRRRRAARGSPLRVPSLPAALHEPKPRLQQGLRLHESLGFFFLSPLLTPHPGSRPAFSLRRQRLRPGAEFRADRNGVQSRTGGNSAHRTAGKGRGPGARRWRRREGGKERVWLRVGGRGEPCGRRAPNPLSAETRGCHSGAASF